MTPRPYHRWKTFWFGLIILAFLGWAWVRSMSHIDGLWYNGPSITLSAGQAGATVDFASDQSRPLSKFQFLRSVHESLPADHGYVWFPKPVHIETYPAQLQVAIAHWFLILLLLVPWAGYLIHRHRRLKCLAAP